MSATEAAAGVVVVDVPEESRYEARVDGELAGIVTYVRKSATIAFMHTEVHDPYGGRGVGSALVRAALDDARSSNLGVLAVCPFFAGWIERHPEYGDLLHRRPSRGPHD